MPHLQNESIEVLRDVNHQTAAHTHSFLELAYVTDGEAVHSFGGITTTVRKGDYFVVDYGVPHAYKSTSDKPYRLINCLFLPVLIDSSLGWCQSFSRLLEHYLIRMNPGAKQISPVNCQFHDSDGTILSYLEQMLAEYEKKEAGYVEVLRSLLVTVLVLSMRTLPETAAYSSPVTAAEGYIRRHYAEPITLSAIASKNNYSTPHFCRKFREETGMSFTEYLSKVRIEEACRLLANTKQRIIDVAAEVGYRDIGSFHRVFRTQMGVSPRDFRKNCQE